MVQKAFIVLIEVYSRCTFNRGDKFIQKEFALDFIGFLDIPMELFERWNYLSQLTSFSGGYLIPKA